MTGTLISLTAYLLVGTLFGLGYFASLRRVTQMFLSEGSIRLAVVLQGVRILVLVAVLYALALRGAGPLIAGALGMIVAREIVLRLARKAT